MFRAYRILFAQQYLHNVLIVNVVIVACCLCNPSGSNVIRSKLDVDSGISNSHGSNAHQLVDRWNNAVANAIERREKHRTLSENRKRIGSLKWTLNEKENERVTRLFKRKKIGEETRKEETDWFQRFYHITFPGQVRRPRFYGKN